MKFSHFSDSLTRISSKSYRFILLIISGLLTGLTLVFTKVGFFEWITLVPMGVVLISRASDRRVKLRSLYLDGFLYYFSYYLVCYHWFVFLYPLDFIDGMSKGSALAVVLLAWLGLSLFQTVMGGAVFVLCGALFRCHLCRRVPFFRSPVAAGLFAVFEWSQTLGWWGVPWGRLPLAQSEYLIGLQTASLFGSYFVTFVILTVNLLLAYCLINPAKVKISCIAAASVLLFQYGAGALIWFTTDLSEGKKIAVSCIQGNISSSEKWETESNIKTKETYRKLILEAAEGGADLIVLPETAYPYDMDSPKQSALNQEFCDIAEEYDAYILVGGFTVEGEKDSLNSLICYTPEGERADVIYSKQHLVPFGEYVPMRELIEILIPPLADLVLSSDDIDAGEGSKVITAGDVKLGGLICFDSIYEQLTYNSVRDGAELICLATNDSWFSDSAALYMHNAQAQLRAIETRRYVARAANTGISTVINSRGEVIDELEPLVEGRANATVYANGQQTLCVTLGNMFVYLLIVFLLAIVGENTVFAVINGKKRKKTT